MFTKILQKFLRITLKFFRFALRVLEHVKSFCDDTESEKDRKDCCITICREEVKHDKQPD